MFSKINFTYKNPSYNQKKFMILKQLQTQQKIKYNDSKSINNSLDLSNKIDTNKIQNIEKIVVESKEYNTDENISIDNNMEIHLYDSSNINTFIIDKIQVDINDTSHDIPISESVELKLYDSSNINTNIIDNIDIPDIILTDEEIKELKDKALYDINKINENINIISESTLTNNFTNYTDSIPSIEDYSIVPFNVNRIRNAGIKIINNVYQSKYNYGKSNSTGLGDFIRGCYFILEFCYKYNFTPKIIFNNCISNFLLMKTHKLELISNVLKSIGYFKSNNFSSYNIQNGVILDPKKDIKNIMADFVEYTVNSPTYYGNVFMFCNSFPMNSNIPESSKAYMRNILEPTNEMKKNMREVLHGLNIRVKQYSVIHVRSGDSYLKKESNILGDRYIKNLVTTIKSDIGYNNNGESNHVYLVIADNNIVKNMLKNVFPNFKILLKDITHFGEGVVLEEEKVKNTLVDFYLLSYSNSIRSYSCYQHGSGFSYWCAKTYNIPYICKLVT